MPINAIKNKTVWTAKDVYKMLYSAYGNSHAKAIHARKKEAAKYTIPYIPEKEIMLTTGRYNTGKISTNLLDSIYDAAKRTNTPVDIALGLAGRESTLGIGRGFKKGQNVTSTDLYSNWQQIQPIPNTNVQVAKYNKIVVKEHAGEELTDEDYQFKSDFIMRGQKALENTKLIKENPIDNALKFYQTGKYNPGDKNHSKMVEEDGKLLMSDPAIQKWLKTKNNSQMKCGGRRKAQLGLDIREGGIAIPIANNMFYIDGRKHAAGGVAIGPNNKNGVEVEGGEVVEMIDSKHPSVGRQFKAGGQQQTMRVFSSVPFLRGASPAELVLGGANPDAVFKAQEEFKDRNRINDDGTTYEMGGEGKSKSKRSRPITGVLPYGYTIRNLYAVENPYRKGIKGNVAKMYDSRTLGAGVDVVSGHPELYKKAKSGKMTKKQADETAVIHLRKDDNAIRSNYADVYGKAAADTLSYGPRFLVAQARYQQGNVRKAWKPIHEAMAKGDAKALKKAVLQVTPKDHEYRRKWIEDFKVYKMGGMIYEINGNVKNGLMSVRPKAEWGKGKNEGTWNYSGDPENFVRGFYQITPYGKIYSDSDSFLLVNGEILKKKSPGFMEEAIKYQANKRPQYYAEKRLPIAGGQSIAEKAGLARSGWSYADSPTLDYVPNINISVPINYARAVGDNTKKSTSSTARGRGTKVSTPKAAAKTTTKGADVKYSTPLKEKKESLYMTGIKNNSITPLRAGMEKIKSPSSTGGGTQSKDERLIPQFKPINTGDWIGLGSNLAGHIASYFINNNLLDKYPMPTKPALFQSAKLKTTHNINPKLATSHETEQMNLAEVGRNTSSSSTSIARKQRIMNEARDARNKLYGEKENIETQLINLDRRNRQDVFNRNIAAYNDWLDKTYIAKTNKLLEKQKNMMSLINGIPGAVNHALGIIETRRNANNAYKAIAAANPNVDGRLLGIGDYYVGEKTKKKYDKFGNLIG